MDYLVDKPRHKECGLATSSSQQSIVSFYKNIPIRTPEPQNANFFTQFQKVAWNLFIITYEYVLLMHTCACIIFPSFLKWINMTAFLCLQNVSSMIWRTAFQAVHLINTTVNFGFCSVLFCSGSWVLIPQEALYSLILWKPFNFDYF